MSLRLKGKTAGKNEGKSDVFTRIGTPGVKGYLNLWILSLLSKRRMNGYEMLKEIAEATNNYWVPKTGSLYPTLHNLERKNLVRAKREGKRGQIVYALTPVGKDTLKEIRLHVRNIHKTHKFRRMFESLMWPGESEELGQEIDRIHESIARLREHALNEKEKIRRLRAAAEKLSRG